MYNANSQMYIWTVIILVIESALIYHGQIFLSLRVFVGTFLVKFHRSCHLLEVIALLCAFYSYITMIYNIFTKIFTLL
jgi:hypothetical protein